MNVRSRQEFLAIRDEWRAAERSLRFWERVGFAGPDDCWLWIGNFTSQKYGIFNWNGKTKAHREAVIQSGREVGLTDVVMHSCDNPPCVNPAHLRVGTALENSHDAARKGRMNFKPHKLTGEDVAYIRRCIARGDCTQSELARIYGVCQSAISAIVLRKAWRWVA